MKYPEISDTEFNSKITKIFGKYKIDEDERSYDEICNPEHFKLQMPQLFVPEFINPKTPYKSILIYHKIGSGKSITAIRIAEEWKYYKKIIIVLPASLRGNFRGELRTEATNNEYLTKFERAKLSKLHPNDKEYTDIIKLSDERINKYYNIYSYNKFIDELKRKALNFNNAILIIDEIQNLISEHGSYYNILRDNINTSPNDLRIILLSASPMFDKPNEIALLMNILKIPHKLPVGRKFDEKFIDIKKSDEKYKYALKNIDIFKNSIKGFISYYRGAPDFVFPETKIKYQKCEMSDFQYKAYISILKRDKKISKMSDTILVKDLPNNFFIGTRIVSNIVFPNKKINELGFSSLTDHDILDNLDQYSTKFFSLLKKIKKNQKIFIYSGFKDYGGIKSLVRILETYGYKNYLKYGEGKKRFALWTGDQNEQAKNKIKAIYNNPNNIDGSRLKIIISSPSGKEGLSLFAVRQLHIIEPYWNNSRIEQVIGRGSRFCSHKLLPPDQRTLNVYIYIATYKNANTVDKYILNIAKQKKKLVQQFETIMKESAIDCQLNYHANENNIVCDK